jgi:hypothetical protein
MGGELRATSSLGVGSSFRFTAEFDAAPDANRKARPIRQNFEGKRALLIDDNPTSGLLLEDTFQGGALRPTRSLWQISQRRRFVRRRRL